MICIENDGILEFLRRSGLLSVSSFWFDDCMVFGLFLALSQVWCILRWSLLLFLRLILLPFWLYVKSWGSPNVCICSLS